MIQEVPVKHIGEPEAVESLVSFLASHGASYVMGHYSFSEPRGIRLMLP
jgi:hypothetical protein